LNASIGASKGDEELSVYHATKAAIRSFARSWTLDLRHRKIRVNAVSPGPIDTPILKPALNEQEEFSFFCDFAYILLHPDLFCYLSNLQKWSPSNKYLYTCCQNEEV
jgi:NAD(P)-dependent dehydrogenase (short-subunit alcohol dehydrogenase family)